jgi:DNA-binding MarR family transcriptional regulator
LRATIIALVRSDTRDLTARQLAVFLTCYLNDEGQTVRGLAAHLKVGKAAITRALDRLENSDLAKRKPDQSDRPNLWVGRTASGIKFLRDVKAIVQKAGASANPTPGS